MGGEEGGRLGGGRTGGGYGGGRGGWPRPYMGGEAGGGRRGRMEHKKAPPGRRLVGFGISDF